MAVAYGVSEFLREHRIPYEVLWHPTAETSMSAAREAGVPSDQVVKAVILESAGRLFMVLVPANRMIHMGALEDYVGADVRIADPAVFESLFEDCEPGVVPATGPAYGIATLLDDSLAQVRDLYFDAGDQEELIHVSGVRFREALGEVGIGRFSCEPTRNPRA
jgi:Ala-tRNA(Pro) deacylase